MVGGTFAALVLTGLVSIPTPICKGQPGAGPPDETTGQSHIVAPIPVAAKEAFKTGNAFYAQKQFPAAAEHFRKAIREASHFTDAGIRLAGTLARMGKDDEALSEMSAMIVRDFVVMRAEISEAFDLQNFKRAPLKSPLDQALQRSAAKWWPAVRGGVFVLARTSKPLRPKGDGTFSFNAAQEVFSWSPYTTRYHQVTSAQGRVVVFLHDRRGQKLAYLRAGKLIRQGNQPTALKQVSLHIVDLTTGLERQHSLPPSAWSELSIVLYKSDFWAIGRDDKNQKKHFKSSAQSLDIREKSPPSPRGARTPERLPYRCKLQVARDGEGILIRSQRKSTVLHSPYGISLDRFPLP